MGCTSTSAKLWIAILVLIGGLALSFVDVEAATIREFTQVGVVIAPKSLIHPTFDRTTVPIDTAAVGDVFFVQDSVDPWWAQDNRGDLWHWVVLPDDRLGWILDRHFKLVSLEYLGVRAQGRECEVWDSIPNGTVVSKLDSGEVCVVQGLVSLTEGSGTRRFFRVARRTPSPHSYFEPWSYAHAGFVKAAEVSLAPERMWFELGLGLGGWGGGGEDTACARRLFTLLLERHADAVFQEPGEYPTIVHGGVVALSYLAELDVKTGSYEKAIKTLEEIGRRYPSVHSGIGIASGVAQGRIAQILWENMRRPREAVAVCQDIIRRFPAEPLEAFEWNTTLDVDAIHEMSEISEKRALQDEELLRLFQWVIDSAGFDVVRMMAYMEKAAIHRRVGRLENATRELMTAMERHPSANMTFYTDNCNFSASALDLLCQMYGDNPGTIQVALDTCTRILERHRKDTLGEVARYLIAEAMDYTVADRARVLTAYQQVLDDSVDWSAGLWARAGSPYLAGQVSSYDVRHRLEAIRAYLPTPGVVEKDSVPLLFRPVTTALKIGIMPRGTKLIAQYSLSFYHGRHQAIWLKVQTGDGTIGWILRDQVALLPREEKSEKKND